MLNISLICKLFLMKMLKAVLTKTFSPCLSLSENYVKIKPLK